MIKKIIPFLMLILMTASVFASTFSYSVPTTATPGGTFTVTYSLISTMDEEFVAWHSDISGGCSPTSSEDFMAFQSGGGDTNPKTVPKSFTAPSSGSCTFTGYYAFGGESQQNLQTKTITIGSSSQCTLGSKECVSSTSYRTCTNGQWGSAVSCPSGQTCSGGVCSSTEQTASITSATYSGTQTINKGSVFTVKSNIYSSSGCSNCVFRSYLIDQQITPFSFSSYVNVNTCGLSPSWFYRDVRNTILSGDTANLEFGFNAQEIGTYDVYVEVLKNCLDTTPIASYKVVDNLRIVDGSQCVRCTSNSMCGQATTCGYSVNSDMCDTNTGLCFKACSIGTYKCSNNKIYSCSLSSGLYDSIAKTCSGDEYCDSGTIMSSATCLVNDDDDDDNNDDKPDKCPDDNAFVNMIAGLFNVSCSKANDYIKYGGVAILLLFILSFIMPLLKSR